MLKAMYNPFHCLRPVSSEQFVGREVLVYSLFQRICNSDSSAIVGTTRIGKTSLLKYLNTRSIQERFLGNQSTNYHFFYMDCHPLPSDLSPAVFWRMIIEQIPLQFLECPLSWGRSHSLIDKNNPMTVFRWVGEMGRKAVLLLDEFDTLLRHPNLRSPEFFGNIRSWASLTHGLVVVFASRRSLSELNEMSQSVNPHGSPYFNIFDEVMLGPFTNEETERLLFCALFDKEIAFSSSERDFIIRSSGGHPFLAQAAGAALFDAMVAGARGEELLERTADLLRPRATAWCEEQWGLLDPKRREALMAISAHTALDSSSSEESPRLERLSLALEKLERLGFLAKDGGTWRIRPVLLAKWLQQQCAARDQMQASVSVRELIGQLFPTDSEFDSFCQDCYPRIYRMFSAGMNRSAKYNLLIEAIEHSDLLDNLTGYSVTKSPFC